MNYFEQIAERLLQPGTFLLVLGAILVYTSGIVARKLFSGSGHVAIVGMNPHIARLFHMSGLDRIIRQLDKHQEAQA